MKYTYLLFVICSLCLFVACEPKFDLNAPNKDVTIVYGILNHQDSIHYVKIYKGFQPYGKNGVYIDAQNPDSIYYNPAHIKVVLQEYIDGRRTLRPNIKLEPTNDFPRDSGIFYYGDDRIIYYTKELIDKDMSYKIVITNLRTGKVTDGETPIIGNFIIRTKTFDMTGEAGEVSFSKADHAAGYEIHVNFIYFEVDKNNEVVRTGRVVRNVTPTVGEVFFTNPVGDFRKSFPVTFYDDIAAQLKPDPSVRRFVGTPTSPGLAIEAEGWAAGESLIQFLLSNKPSSSFTQISTIYTNMKTSDDELAFGFLSSKSKSVTRFSITGSSEEELIKGSKTGHLGFKPWVEWVEISNP